MAASRHAASPPARTSLAERLGGAALILGNLAGLTAVASLVHDQSAHGAPSAGHTPVSVVAADHPPPGI